MMCDSCGCGMPDKGRSRFRTLLLALSLAALASFTASTGFASTVILSAADESASTQLTATCCGNCIPGVPCCGYCTPDQKRN